MSTYSFVPMLRKGMRAQIALSLLTGVLIALQLVLPSSAFASAPQSGFTFGTSRDLDRASVSVVRLVVSYTPVSSPGILPTPTGGCGSSVTGLGVLVGSWKTARSADFTNWVLTDSALVNPKGITCFGKASPALNSLEIYANTAYTSLVSNHLLQNIACQSDACRSSILCHLQSASVCSGVVLIAFQTTLPQPFVDVASSEQSTPAPKGIDLLGSSTAAASPTAAQASQFLTPTLVSAIDEQNELGLPTVNSDGQLLDLNNKDLDPAGSIRDFVTTQLHPLQAGNTNALHEAWNKGISDYYLRNYPQAQRDFQQAQALNPQFQAPSTFLTLSPFQSLPKKSTPGSARATPSSSPASNRQNTAVPNWMVYTGLIGGVLLLGLILLLVSIAIVRRQRRERKKFEELDRRATVDAARIAAQERAERERQRVQARQFQRVPQAQQSPPPQRVPQAQQPVPPVVNQLSPVGNNTGASRVLPISDLRCPNCGAPIQADDNFCPQCRAVLSPTESGLQRSATPLQVPPTAAPPPVSPVAPSVPSPMPAFTPSTSISDQPTMPGNGQIELEKTLPFTVEQLSARNLGLAVGTRSDPGIKRQHKPNEDSLFAAQGERMHNSQSEQFGLFVVADGMGGHANGQDASRLAIQTIVDHVLPKLSSTRDLTDDALVQLLVQGVQEANLAVHQRNMEHRADMGTTMTAALVVGAKAYIANVGDSRTYLFRQPDGLKKITNDHSVVASLVEAGIIKPDDIYTHPKRNQIYRSLGEKPVIDVDTFVVPLQPGDKLLLCSDGLWDMVRDPAIEKLISTPVPDPAQTGNALIKAALDEGGEDNVSVIVIHVTEATKLTGRAGVQLLARPEAPQYPPM